MVAEIKVIKGYLGEMIPAGILLISYDQHSLGWRLGVRLLKEEIENGAFVIMTNVALPLRKFCARMRTAGLDVMKEGERGNLAVINAFGEKRKNSFVYNMEKVDESVFIPKYFEIKQQILRDYNLSARKIVHVFATLDMLYEHFGESFVKSFLRAQLIDDEKMVDGGYSFWSMFIVNRDVVPDDLHSWFVSLSDYVILTRGILKEDEFIENIAILKGTSEDFMPVVLQMKMPVTQVPSGFVL
ncbi:hypothetical protein [Thermococcus sp.]